MRDDLSEDIFPYPLTWGAGASAAGGAAGGASSAAGAGATTFSSGGAGFSSAPYASNAAPSSFYSGAGSPVGGGGMGGGMSTGQASSMVTQMGEMLQGVARSIYGYRSAMIAYNIASTSRKMDVARIYSDTAARVGTAAAVAGAQGRKQTGSVAAVKQAIGQAGEWDAIATAYRYDIAKKYYAGQAKLSVMAGIQQGIGSLIGASGSTILGSR